MEDKKKEKLMIFTFTTLALSLVSTISYMIYTLVNSASLVNRAISIIGVIMLVAFSIVLVITGFYIENKKAKIFISIASILLAIYSLFSMITGIINPKDKVLDFTNYDIKEVTIWAKERNIELIQEFAYSDTIDEFHIIKQDVEKGTLVKKIKRLTVVISNGIDPTKRTDITNMVGWKLYDVVKFIDNNHLTNVTIKFEFSNTVEKDIIISQDVIKEVKRNEPITLVSSLGKESELKSVSLENLVGLDIFHAGIYLGRNNIKYSVEYAYSKDKKEGTVLKQSIKKWTNIEPNSKETIILTIAKENQVTVPNLYKMTEEEINEWALENRIYVSYTEEYSDSKKEGKVISASYEKGTNIESGTIISIVISKGQLKMIEFTTLEEFRKWASEKEINYTVEYEYSTSISKGKLISASHAKGDIIKDSDTINLVISKGGNTKVPNLIGLTKSDAESRCRNANIKCSFIGTGSKVIKQSMVADSTVPQETSITLTLGE